MAALPDLSKLNRPQLLELQTKIAARLAEIDEETRAEARAQILKIAEEAGYPVEELIKAPRRRKSKKSAGAKKGAASLSNLIYKNPDDPEQTWNNRGRKPAWFRRLEEQGLVPEATQSEPSSET